MNVHPSLVIMAPHVMTLTTAMCATVCHRTMAQRVNFSPAISTRVVGTASVVMHLMTFRLVLSATVSMVT